MVVVDDKKDWKGIFFSWHIIYNFKWFQAYHLFPVSVLNYSADGLIATEDHLGHLCRCIVAVVYALSRFVSNPFPHALENEALIVPWVLLQLKGQFSNDWII